MKKALGWFLCLWPPIILLLFVGIAIGIHSIVTVVGPVLVVALLLGSIILGIHILENE